MKYSRYQWTWSLVALLIITSMILGACATPTPQVIEKVVTQVVEKPVEKVVEKPVEKVVEKVVTATPAPAAAGPKLNPAVKGTVELWHWWASPVRRNGVRRIIAMCEQKLPNIKVTDTVKPYGDTWTANVAAVAAGTGMPDVIVSDRPTLPKDAADGVYTNLQAWATRDGVTRDQFYGWAWDQTLYKGETYGIPFETDVRVLFWNKQAFKEAGLDPEVPPKTWDDLWAYADKLDKKKADGGYERIAFFPL
jgi:multiple sugar transport system substrate-binding protein